MSKLQTLLKLCKCSVTISINEHRDYYQSVVVALQNQEELDTVLPITYKIKQGMIETDTIVKIQFYPNTPIGSYTVWHHDLDAALDQCLEILSGM